MTDPDGRAAAPRDLAREITDEICKLLEQGVRPWRQPWDVARCGGRLPLRANGAPYRGVNVLMLWIAAAAGGHASPYWMTYRQAQALGGQVRKGARGRRVVYYGDRTRTTAQGEEERFRFLKSYSVFNTDQIEGLDSAFHPPAIGEGPRALDWHEAWYARLAIPRFLTHGPPCYVPARDAIGMPPARVFDTPEDYAATLNHECVHATLAPGRLDRNMGKRFPAAGYAAEELVAEIGAAILGAHLRLPPAHLVDHASYIGAWLGWMRNDKRAFLVAAGEAQRAVDWLLAKSPAPESEAHHVPT